MHLCGISLFCALATIILTAPSSRPRFVDLDKELVTASYIGYVKVLGYTDSTLLYEPADSSEVLYTSFWWDMDNNLMKSSKYRKEPLSVKAYGKESLP